MGIVSKIISMRGEKYVRTLTLEEICYIRINGCKGLYKEELKFFDCIFASKKSATTTKETLKIHIFRYSLTDTYVTQSFRTLTILITATCKRFWDPKFKSFIVNAIQFNNSLFEKSLLLFRKLLEKEPLHKRQSKIKILNKFSAIYQ